MPITYRELLVPANLSDNYDWGAIKYVIGTMVVEDYLKHKMPVLVKFEDPKYVEQARGEQK